MGSQNDLSLLRPLIVCLSHSWGGLEQVAADDAIELARLGIETRVLVLEGSPIDQNLEAGAHANLKLEKLDYRPRDTFDFQLKKDLTRLILAGVNIVHAHQPTLLGSLSPWLKGFPNVAFLMSRHIMSSHSKRDPYHRWLYKRVDRLVVMSESMRENVLRTHPLNPEKIELVRLGLDFDRFDPEKVQAERQRQAWGARESTIVIGLVGRIDPAKGQSTFLQAAAGLRHKVGGRRDLRFVIVGEETLGSNSGYLEELRKMVLQFQLQDEVVFAGFQKEIPEIMQAFDIFVMPSHQEAFGLVAIEAMAMECPIIISSGGSSQEIVGKEEFGLIMRPSDAFDLQKQMLILIENEELRRDMGKRAREQVKGLYDRKVRTKRTIQVYQDVLSKRSSI